MMSMPVEDEERCVVSQDGPVTASTLSARRLVAEVNQAITRLLERVTRELADANPAAQSLDDQSSSSGTTAQDRGRCRLRPWSPV
jgi:hypothetical protein